MRKPYNSPQARHAPWSFALLACLPGIAFAADSVSQWPTMFDVLLMLIVAGSIIYLLYDTGAARRSRRTRQLRDDLWNGPRLRHRVLPRHLGSQRDFK